MNRTVRLVCSLGLAAVVAAAPALADVWKIDASHSSAQFSVTHLMISTVRGAFGTMSGTVEYDGKSVASIKDQMCLDVHRSDNAVHDRLIDAIDVVGAELRREQPLFANARSVRNALDRARLRQADRHLAAGIVRVDDLSIIEGADIRASRVFQATTEA